MPPLLLFLLISLIISLSIQTKISAMEYTEFEYTVSPRRHSTSPLAVELTCTEVRRRIICHPQIDNEPIKSSMPFPNKTIVHHSGFIPLNKPNDVVVVTHIDRSSNGTSAVISRPSTTTSNNYSLSYARISQILRNFGLTNYGCSTILRDIDKVIILSSLKDKGVIEVKIWKIINKVYKMESLHLERYGIDSDESKDNNGCVICMEDYTQGIFVANKLPCNHDFHATCILKWLKISRRCPLCRFPITLQGKSAVDADFYING